MDVYCVKCSEPVEIDYFHDVAQDLGSTFDKVRQDFGRRGCVALGGPPCEADGSLRSAASAALFDMLGDDIDGIASMLDDFEYAGMLDD